MSQYVDVNAQHHCNCRPTILRAHCRLPRMQNSPCIPGYEGTSNIHVVALCRRQGLGWARPKRSPRCTRTDSGDFARTELMRPFKYSATCNAKVHGWHRRRLSTGSHLRSSGCRSFREVCYSGCAHRLILFHTNGRAQPSGKPQDGHANAPNR